MDVSCLRYSPIYILTLKSFNKRGLMPANEFHYRHSNGLHLVLEPAALYKPTKFFARPDILVLNPPRVRLAPRAM